MKVMVVYPLASVTEREHGVSYPSVGADTLSANGVHCKDSLRIQHVEFGALPRTQRTQKASHIREKERERY